MGAANIGTYDRGTDLDDSGGRHCKDKWLGSDKQRAVNGQARWKLIGSRKQTEVRQ